MTENLITVSPLLSTQELALLFETRHISGVPVVDDDGSLLGIVTKTDLIRSQARGSGAEPVESAWFHHACESVGHDSTPPRADCEGLCRLHGPSPLDSTGIDTSVREVMNTNVFSIEADRPLPEIARAMLAHRVHRLLVTRKGRLVGIVTSTDLLKVLAAR